MAADSILVCGGAGYIGSHVCKALERAGYRPVTLDDLSSGHDWAVRWGPLERVELSDATALDRIFRTYQPKAVLHLAGMIDAAASVQVPEVYYLKNLRSLAAVTAAMRRHGPTNLVFSSSAAVYGAPQDLPIGEDHPLAPINPYGQSKLMCERLLADCETAFGLRSVSLRYFNAAGADPEGEIGEAHHPETHLIPLALDAALRPVQPLLLFGTDHPTADGTALRDYVHVSDLAAAHLAAMRYLLQGGRSLPVNLGSGVGYTVRQVLQSVARITGRDVPLREEKRRPGDPPRLIADISRAKAVLGWEPECSDLDTMITTAAAWLMRSTSDQRGQDRAFHKGT